MSKRMSGWGSALGTLLLLSSAGTASGQFYAGNNSCYCVQAVPQTVYQSVPVTEYRQVQQTVRRPVVETQYVEQPVTEYRQVVETRVAEVPTVTYETATEWRTVQRDYGNWVTQYQPNPRVSPCEYDGRPNLLGWLNRTGYAVRSAFTPSYTASRHYVPNVVAQNVPITHQIPIHGTRQVTYNVTKSVPHTTTKRVAVNTVRYVDETVTAMQPVTVVRNVPIGSQVAYAYSPLTPGLTQTVLNPVPDPISAAQPSRTAESPTPANNSNNDDRFTPRNSNRNNNKNNPSSGSNDGDMFGPSTRRSAEREIIRPASMSAPVQDSSAQPAYPDSRTVDIHRFGQGRPAAGYQDTADHQHTVGYGRRPDSDQFDSDRPVSHERFDDDAPAFTASTPSVVRVNRWVARKRPAEEGPALVNPGVSVAGH